MKMKELNLKKEQLEEATERWEAINTMFWELDRIDNNDEFKKFENLYHELDELDCKLYDELENLKYEISELEWELAHR